MSKTITYVVKWIAVLVTFSALYLFMFGTSKFFVNGSGSTFGSYDGAIAVIITGMERPMAVYYSEYTYKSNQETMKGIEASLSGKALKVYTP